MRLSGNVDSGTRNRSLHVKAKGPWQITKELLIFELNSLHEGKTTRTSLFVSSFSNEPRRGTEKTGQQEFVRAHIQWDLYLRIKVVPEVAS